MARVHQNPSSLLEHYSHICMKAKRAALDAVVNPVLTAVWHKTGRIQPLAEKLLSLTERKDWWALVDDLRTLPPGQIVAGIPHIGAPSLR